MRRAWEQHGLAATSSRSNCKQADYCSTPSLRDADSEGIGLRVSGGQRTEGGGLKLEGGRSKVESRNAKIEWSDYCWTSFVERCKISGMNLSNFVSLHPYFSVHPGNIEAFKAGFEAFVEKTRSEKKNLFYGFTVNGDEVFCREGYTDAEGLLAHLENIGALLAEALKIADLIRLEVHGPAAELDKLREPLAHLKPEWFVLEGK
jgi:quinol monooxygenase YgiN